MNSIELRITSRLEELADQESIKIPIAVESGSRSWGFPSPDSDYDCRFIYIHSPEWYLSVFHQRDTLEDPVDKVFDVGGWDLKKVIYHLTKSNAVMLEWLSSELVYQRNDQVWTELWNLGVHFFNPLAVSWHYLNMAKNKLQQIKGGEEVKLKTYFYVMRPLAALQFIKMYQTIPNMNYLKNLEKIQVPAPIRQEIEQLLEDKKIAAEGQLAVPNDTLIQYFSDVLSEFEGCLKTIKFTKVKNFELADQVFRKLIGMVWNYE